jgi:VWFA-related protein
MKRVCKTIFFVLVGMSAVAQEPVAPRVAIPLFASDSHHHPITVTVESLSITDQKTPVAGASLLWGADLPMELGVLIDVSNSQRSSLRDDYLKAINLFVHATIRGPEDRVFFLQFDSTPHATGWLTKEQLPGTKFNVRIGGATALYDALAMACKERMGPRDWRKPTRRVLVLISDGDDNLSHNTHEEAALEALRAGVVIFTINTQNSVIHTQGERVIENWTKLTGGESFAQLVGNDIPKVFVSIQKMIDGMYFLSYVQPDSSKNALHEHEVEVKPAQKGKFQLSYAKKYFWNP